MLGVRRIANTILVTHVMASALEEQAGYMNHRAEASLTAVA